MLVDSELLEVPVLISPVDTLRLAQEYSLHMCAEWKGEENAWVNEWLSHVPVWVSSPISHSG